MCHKSTVFFIEDDIAVRDALSISLTMAGLTIEVYPSGTLFLAAYTNDRPGCLLINLSQPDMEGLAVQQELIIRRFLIPIIFMTDIGTIRGSLPALQSGAFCLLEKPFSRQLLLDCIRAALEHDCRNRRTATITEKRRGRKRGQANPSGQLGSIFSFNLTHNHVGLRLC